ncbi:MAG: FKBP-type peptidyl-prolyl cis-trans isomerase [Bacteroidota bacterium]
MRILLNGLVLLGTVLFLSSCAEGEVSATNGMKYKLIKVGEGEFAKNGEYLVVNMEYKDQNDSVWLSTAKNGSPMPLLKDSTWATSEGSIYSIFADLKQGDSVEFSVSCMDLFKNTFKTPIPPQVDSTAMLTFNMGVEGIYDMAGISAWQQEQQQKMMAKQQEEAVKQKEEDLAIIASYLDENNIDAQTTDAGLSYVITQEGEGEVAPQGSLVSVDYTGWVLNGAHFDSSNEEVAKEHGLFNAGREYGPYEFRLGTGNAIAGWHEGIALLNKGAKATLYIPSGMAYGPRQRSAVILPNSILVFDVELVEIVN